MQIITEDAYTRYTVDQQKKLCKLLLMKLLWLDNINEKSLRNPNPKNPDEVVTSIGLSNDRQTHRAAPAVLQTVLLIASNWPRLRA